MKIEGAVPKKVIFYEEKKSKSWHRYADVIVPLITLPTLVFIGLYLHNYVMDPQQQRDPGKWKVFALGGALLVVSFTVFCYLCIRLNPSVLGRRKFKTNFSLIRSSSTNTCFMKSVNSDLQFMLPFNNRPPSYESIILDVPPSYTVVSSESFRTYSKNYPEKIVEI